MGRAQLYTCDHCREAHRVDRRGPLGTLAVGGGPPPGWSNLAFDREPTRDEGIEPAACILEPVVAYTDTLEVGQRMRLQGRPQRPFRVRRIVDQRPVGFQFVTYDHDSPALSLAAFRCTQFVVGTENQLASPEPLPAHALALADCKGTPAAPGISIVLELEALERTTIGAGIVWAIGETPKLVDVDDFELGLQRARGALLCPRCTSSLRLTIDGKPLELVQLELGAEIVGDDLGHGWHGPRRPIPMRRVR